MSHQSTPEPSRETCSIEPAFSQHEYAVAYCDTHDQPADQCAEPPRERDGLAAIAMADAEPPTLQAAIDRFYRLIDGPEPHDYEVIVPVGVLRKAARAIWQQGTENG